MNEDQDLLKAFKSFERAYKKLEKAMGDGVIILSVDGENLMLVRNYTTVPGYLGIPRCEILEEFLADIHFSERYPESI